MVISHLPSESSAQCLLQTLLDYSQCNQLSSNDVDNEADWWKANERRISEDIVCDQDGSIIQECVNTLLRMMQTTPMEDTVVSLSGQSILKSHVFIAVIRLVRILLQSPKSLFSSTNHAVSSDSMRMQFSISLIDELSKCIKTSLTHITKTTMTASTETTSIMKRTQQIAVFILDLFLRIFDRNFLYSCILLLPVVWRNSCDIFMLLFSDPTVLDTHSTIVEAFAKQLVQYLNDIEIQIQNILISQLILDIDASKTWDGLPLQNNMKIVVFFITRLHSISNILISSLFTSNQQYNHNLKQDLLFLLCRLRGLHGATQVMFQSRGVVDGDVFMTIMEQLFKLRQKVDLCLEPIFFNRFNKKNERTDALTKISSTQARVALNESMIQLLLTLGDTINMLPNLEKDGETLTHGSFVLGYAQWLLFVLKTASRVQMDEVIQNKDLQINRVLTDDALTICERFLFQILPFCQPWLATPKNKIQITDSSYFTLSGVIESIVDCTLACHRSLSLVGDITSIHHTITRWLCTRSEDHPISIETSIVVAHIHIARLIYYESSSSSRPYSSADCFITLLSSLVFDRRTNINLRKNIAFLLCRLLRHDNQEHKAANNTLSSVQDIMKSMTHNAICKISLTSRSSESNLEENGKRKRATYNSEHWLLDAINADARDLEYICLVLRMTFSRPRIAPHADSTLKEFMAYQYSIILQSTKIMARVEDSCRTTSLHTAHMRRENKLLNSLCIAFSCLQGILSTQSSIDDFNINHFLTHFVSIFSHFSNDPKIYSRNGSDICSIILQTIQTARVDRSLYLAEIFLNAIPFSTQKQTTLSFSFKYRTLSFISSIAQMIPSDVSKHFLTGCSNLFHSMTSSLLWPNSLGAMQYFEKFAASIATTHRNVLLCCINTDSQALVQSRLRAENYYSKNIHSNFLFMKLRECFNDGVMISCNRRKSTRAELDIVLTPHSRVFCLKNNSCFFIIPSTACLVDDEYLRQLVGDTNNFTEVTFSRFIMKDTRLLLRAKAIVEDRTLRTLNI